jgi:predicted nucleic acid-binding protein
MPADRLFLDADVLFSAAYGSPGLVRLWKLAEQVRAQLVASSQVEQEARRNLSTPEQRERLTAYLRAVEFAPLPDPDLPCPVELPLGDRLVLLTAVAAHASHLLTGDRKHFGPYYGRRVLGVLLLPPADYLRKQG